MIELKEVKSDKEYKTAIELFEEYASQIGIDLEFQNFNEEIKNIKSQYSKPNGAIFTAYNGGNLPVGCFGIRKIDKTICELKRMYLRKEARGLGTGKLLLKKAIEIGKELGFERMRLDTLPTMHSAIGLYIKVGFYEIEPYRFNPIEGTKYLEIKLN
ncbi:MAG: GNAT family N-acetyltransferase [Bacteroidota bacterium]